MTPVTGSLVLAIYPNVSGLCFAVFEGNGRAIDWGIKTARQRKQTTLLLQAVRLIDAFSPAIVILPVRWAMTKGAGRLQRLTAEIEHLARGAGASVHAYSRSDIQTHFADYGATSKDAIARVITRLMPEFEQHLPPIRKIWMSEDYRMGVFDALALALTFYRMRESEANINESV